MRSATATSVLCRDLLFNSNSLFHFQNNVTRGQGDLESQLEESKSKLTAASSELIVERKKAAKQLVFQTRFF